MFFKKHKGALIVAAVILLVLALAVSSFYTKGRVSPLSSAVNAVFRPLHSLIGSVTDYFVSRSEIVLEYEELLAKYESLRVFVANKEEERRSIEEILAENAVLRQMLELNPREKGFTLELAVVTDRAPSDWERSFTLSKGSEAGIEAGQCVVSPEMYVVGVVSQVGADWASVNTVIDASFAAGAVSERTGQTAVAGGEWALMREGRLKLSYLPAGSDILHGDLFLTSGQGGLFPPGLPLGRAAAVLTEPSGQAEYAELIPEADLDALTQVFIILDFYVIS